MHDHKPNYVIHAYLKVLKLLEETKNEANEDSFFI